MATVEKLDANDCDWKLKGMSIRTNAQMFYGLTRSEVTDNFDIRSYCTPQIDEAFIQVFKCTLNEMVLKIDAFVIGGLAGVIALQGQSKSVRTKTEIRDMIMKGFRECDLVCCRYGTYV